MILTEQGLHFRRDGDRWRCVEHPLLEMLPRSGLYVIAGHDDHTYADALEALGLRVREPARGRRRGNSKSQLSHTEGGLSTATHTNARR